MGLYVPPAIRRCTDVSLAGLADGDLLSYTAATGIWSVVTRAAVASAAAVYLGASLQAVNSPTNTNTAMGITLITNVGGFTVSAPTPNTLSFPVLGRYLILADLDRSVSNQAVAAAHAANAVVSFRQDYFNGVGGSVFQKDVYGAYVVTAAGAVAEFNCNPVSSQQIVTVTDLASTLQIVVRNELTTGNLTFDGELTVIWLGA